MANTDDQQKTADKKARRGPDKSRNQKRALRYLSVAAGVREAADAGEPSAQNELTLSVGAALTYALLDVADAVRDAGNGTGEAAEQVAAGASDDSE
jgi:hypothetical protein